MKSQQTLLDFLQTLTPDQWKDLDGQIKRHFEVMSEDNEESLKDKEFSRHFAQVKLRIEREGYEEQVVRKFEELQARLKDAEDALKIYADKKNWIYDDEYGCCDFKVDEDQEDITPADSTSPWKDIIAGKKAREYFEKYGFNKYLEDK